MEVKTKAVVSELIERVRSVVEQNQSQCCSGSENCNRVQSGVTRYLRWRSWLFRGSDKKLEWVKVVVLKTALRAVIRLLSRIGCILHNKRLFVNNFTLHTCFMFCKMVLLLLLYYGTEFVKEGSV
eukprot:scaffold10141_cov60-Cyclotella_meneghiniana.AAC.5